MKKIAFLFPGQGSQKVGMGADLYNAFDEAKSIYLQANAELNYSLSDICFNGPEDKLNATTYAQPAILTTSIATLRIIESLDIKPEYVAGHSLGEYSALVAANVLEFKEAVSIAQKRAEYMQKAVAAGEGAMAAILGLEREKVIELCRRYKADEVVPANFNCPKQIVVSGRKNKVEEITRLAMEEGAIKAVVLPVSVPSHCLLMKPAMERLSEYLKTIEFRDPQVKVIKNCDAEILDSKDQVLESLNKQLISSVYWEDSINYLLKAGVDLFLEIGPANVLAGLMKRIDRKAKILSINSKESIEKIKEYMTL